MKISVIKRIIELSFKEKEKINSNNIQRNVKNAISFVLHSLEEGTLRIVKKVNKKWFINSWIKKAILLYFKTSKCFSFQIQKNCFFDKFHMKFSNWNSEDFLKRRIRVIFPSNVRTGAYIGKNTIIMPSFINVGAYVDDGTMIDTWSTVGSCAQIGKNVHLSGGVGIGGVLEPIQSYPTIIEDNCFIGARSEIVEGVIVGKGSVISMGVFIGKSTKILDRETGKVHYGYVPPGSVVVSGSISSKDRSHSIYCAIIVKKVDKRTKNRVELNSILRSL